MVHHRLRNPDCKVYINKLKNWINDTLSADVEVTGDNKTDVIVKLKDGISRMKFFSDLSDKASAEGIEIEHFETYKPSLNDIFVERVGEEEKDHEESSEGGEDNE